MSRRSKIVVIGSLIFDFVTTADRLPRKGETIMGKSFGMFTGGKGANQAVQAARLGADVCIVGRVGNDFLGEKLLSNLEKDGINTKHIKKDLKASTSAYCIHVDVQGNNDIIISPEANMAVTKEDVDDAMEEISKANIIMLQLEIPIDVIVYAAQKAAELNIPVILNPAPATRIPEQLFKTAAYITPNETEAEFFSGVPLEENNSETWDRMASQKLLNLGAKNVIITLGKRGAYVAAMSICKRFKTFEHIKAVDTTAAGDAFNGALAVALSEGKEIGDAIIFANAAGSLAASKAGSQSSLCSRAELEELLKHY